MKRFFTVSAKDKQEVIKILRNAVIMNATSDAYHWLKKQLQSNQISHHDQDARSHQELPHQGGFSSFYVDTDGQWVSINH